MNEIDETMKSEEFLNKEVKHMKKPKRTVCKKNYVFSILIYLLIMFFLNTFILLAFKQIPSAIKSYTPDEVTLEKILDDVSGITLMNVDTYDLYIDEYDRYLGILGWTFNPDHPDVKIEYIIYNRANIYVDKLLFTWNYSHTVVVGFDNETLLNIYTDGPDFLNYWDEEETLKITRYQTDGPLPGIINTDDLVIIDYTASSLNQFYGSLYNLSIYVILIVLLLIFLIKDLKYDFNRFKIIKRKRILKSIALGYLFVFLGSYLSTLIKKLLSNILSIPINVSVNQMSIVRSLSSNGVFFSIISIVIIAPIVEELIFRKSIFALIRNKYVALIFSSILFAAIHLTYEASFAKALLSGVSYFIMGLIFGYIYIRNKKNIMAPIIVHMINNLVSTLLILLF